MLRGKFIAVSVYTKCLKQRKTISITQVPTEKLEKEQNKLKERKKKEHRLKQKLGKLKISY